MEQNRVELYNFVRPKFVAEFKEFPKAVRLENWLKAAKESHRKEKQNNNGKLKLLLVAKIEGQIPE